MRIEITPYNPHWPEQFSNERERIAAALGPFALSIDHIGSTAIPGLAAKPVVDMQVGVSSLQDFDTSEAASSLERLGYVHRTDLQASAPFRRFFARRNHLLAPDAHIHLVANDHPWRQRHLLFRDYLRANDGARDRYQALKLALAERDWVDINGYTDAKTELILQLEEEAFAFFALTDEHRDLVRLGRIGG
ncbi:hypothetical protein BH09SUM1_BH09SUM1_19040 [soil metagenome]